jgi:alanine racemase
MTIDRRTWLGGVVALGTTHALGATRAAGAEPTPGACNVRTTATEGSVDAAGSTASQIPALGDRFDPWVEVSASAVAHNVAVVSRLVGARPVLAVVKNNAYGLGLAETAKLLSSHTAIGGFAVVKAEDAVALRDAGLSGPVLLMGMAPDDAVRDLVALDVHLSLYLDDDARRLPARVRSGQLIAAHVYLDTGMSRMGIPYHRALPWLERVAASGAFRLDGAFMGFTEETEFDREQLRRFRELTAEARAAGVGLGMLHAASSNGVYHLPEAHLDMVRPGIALFGGYPSRPDEERAIASLDPAFALKCRVVRVERIRAGDSVSYGRSYVAERPTWIATLPAGHADGYPRGAVDGARIAIGEWTYPVIGAVSASHVIVEVGDERSVAVGDVATLVGRGHRDVHPNEVARASGSSVYDRFMHLSPSLPRLYV